MHTVLIIHKPKTLAQSKPTRVTSGLRGLRHN